MAQNIVVNIVKKYPLLLPKLIKMYTFFINLIDNDLYYKTESVFL